MTREIGSTFEYKGNTYKIVEDIKLQGCNNCSFKYIDCKPIKKFSGDCIKAKRLDAKYVHFELVTNNKE